ncbi:MAG TPA: SRPBCC family protein [Steroidobacteraceae bacterium]|jgi:uncharacterized membrane protein|nr:SRPBCC family protein [Steroidobacteraceae bacterium]
MSIPTDPKTQAAPTEDARLEEFVDSVVIARPRHELFLFWRDFGNLPKFMEKVRKVTVVDSLSSIWTVAASSGESTDWEFIVTDEEADRLIAWSASGNTPVKYSGRVEFNDVSPTVTEVTATLRYEPPSGIIDTLLAKVSGTPAADELAVQKRSDLLRFKEVMEATAPAGVVGAL